MSRPSHLGEPSARLLVAGDLETVLLPGAGMLGASLRHKGVELLGRVDDLASAAAKGSTAGVPLLYPWANRLDGLHYRAGGRDVVLDVHSPLLHFDANGLPIHGVPWSLLAWETVELRRDYLAGRFDWGRDELSAVFPFPHRLDMSATLRPDALTLEMVVTAGVEGPVPVSFGFHPYFRLPDLPRAQWRLTVPAMRRLTLDRRGIPTGERVLFDGFDAPLGTLHFDDGFAVRDEPTALTLAGGGHRISVELLEGYDYAQVFAPNDGDIVALEPMTAPTNALVSGDGLHVIEPGGTFRATFRIRITPEQQPS